MPRNPSDRLSDRLVCLVDTTTGVGHGFCSTGCLVRWVRWCSDSFDDQSLAFPKVIVSCRHCYICGRRCGPAPRHCLFHDGECPERDWTRSFAALTLAPLLVAELERDVEPGDLDVLYACYKERDKGEEPESIAGRAAERIRNPSDDPLDEPDA